MLKKLFAGVSILLLLGSISACDETPSDQQSITFGLQAQEGEDAVLDDPAELEEDMAEDPVPGAGFFLTEMSQSEIDELDAQEELIKITNPDGLAMVRAKLIAGDEEGIHLIITVTPDERERVADYLGITSGKVIMRAAAGESLTLDDFSPWLTHTQLQQLRCVAPNEKVKQADFWTYTSTEQSLADQYGRVTMDSEWVSVSADCKTQPVSRRSTYSNILFLEASASE